MNLKAYKDVTNGVQLSYLKHAIIGDRIEKCEIEKGFLKFRGIMTDMYTGEVHKCTIIGCDCNGFKKKKLPCVHMYKLAFEYGMYKEYQKRGFSEKIASLEDDAFEYFESAMYGGYYSLERDIVEGSIVELTDRVKKILKRENLLEFHRGYFTFTEIVQRDIIGYIIATFTDPRSSKIRQGK